MQSSAYGRAWGAVMALGQGPTSGRSTLPVLLGEGRRLFEHLRADHIELELTRIVDTPGVPTSVTG